jgi:hypothetical protein
MKTTLHESAGHRVNLGRVVEHEDVAEMREALRPYAERPEIQACSPTTILVEEIPSSGWCIPVAVLL